MKLVTILVLFFYAEISLASSVKVEFLPSDMRLQSCDSDPGQCRIVDQSGTLEPYDCRNSDGNIRCYADVEYDNGTRLRVWGGCYESFSDCWSTGPGAVDACD